MRNFVKSILLKLSPIKTKIIIWTGAAAVAAVILLTAYSSNLKADLAICQKDQIEIGVKGTQTYVEKQREVMQLPDADLDSRLSKWMRD